MSKLAHSDDANMRLLDVQRAIEDGNEDAVGLWKVKVSKCEQTGCSRNAEFLTSDVEERRRTGKLDHNGTYYCREHAEQWAAKGDA